MLLFLLLLWARYSVGDVMENQIKMKSFLQWRQTVLPFQGAKDTGSKSGTSLLIDRNSRLGQGLEHYTSMMVLPEPCAPILKCKQ